MLLVPKKTVSRKPRSKIPNVLTCLVYAWYTRGCSRGSISNFDLKLQKNIFEYAYYWLRLSAKNAFF